MVYRWGAGRDGAREGGWRQITEPCAKPTDLSLSLKDSKQGMMCPDLQLSVLLPAADGAE